MQNEHKSSTEITTNSSGDNRRRFLKKAAIGAPVLLASTAKPAWATTTPDCMSGLMSGNISNHTHTCSLNGGFHSAQWIFEGTDGSKCYFVPGTNQQTTVVDPKSDVPVGGLGNNKLEDLFNGSAFEKEIAAAYLNAVALGLSYPYSVTEVVEIYMIATDPSPSNNVTEAEVAAMLQSIHT